MNSEQENRKPVTVQIDPFLAEIVEGIRLDWRCKSTGDAVDQLLMLAIAATRAVAPIGVVR